MDASLGHRGEPHANVVILVRKGGGAHEGTVDLHRRARLKRAHGGLPEARTDATGATHGVRCKGKAANARGRAAAQRANRTIRGICAQATLRSAVTVTI